MFKHLNNQITIGDLALPTSFFQQLEPNYNLEDGWTGQVYVPGQYRMAFKINGTTLGIDPNWSEGSTYIEKEEVYRTAWNLANTPSNPTPITPQPNWIELSNALRGSSLFAKAYGTTSQNGWSLLLSALDRAVSPNDPGRLADFQFAIGQIRLGLTEDFTIEEIEAFNVLLEENNFPFTVEP